MPKRTHSAEPISTTTASGKSSPEPSRPVRPQTSWLKILKHYIMNGCIAYTLILVFLAVEDCLGHTTDFSARFLLHMLAATFLVMTAMFVTDRLPIRIPLLFLAVQVTAVFASCYLYMGLVARTFRPSPEHAARMYLLTAAIYLVCTLIVNLDNNTAAEAINRKLREKNQNKDTRRQSPPSKPSH